MRNLQTVLALVLPAVVALPVQAGIIFGKHAKPNPAQRVPELVVMVKTDQNESHRESAAKELRNYDPAVYTDIVPVLIDVLQHDASTGVRLEAAQSLGKLRPVSQEAGWALEQALKDSSIRVRIQARNSLWGYRLSGYHSDNHMAQTPVTAMPPTAPVIAPPPATATPATTMPATAAKSPLSFLNPFRQASNPPPSVTVRPSNASVINAGETPPPPLAKPAAETPRAPKPSTSDAGPDLSPGKD
jgi:HEAT repeats